MYGKYCEFSIIWVRRRKEEQKEEEIGIMLDFIEWA